MKRFAIFAAGLFGAIASPTFGQAPNPYNPADIAEYQRVCAAERAEVAQNYVNDQASRFHRSVTREDGLQWADHGVYDDGRGPIEVFWRDHDVDPNAWVQHNRLSGPGLMGCAARLRLAQLSRPPAVVADRSRERAQPSVPSAVNDEAAASPTNPTQQPPRRRRPPPPQYRVSYQHVGETQCFTARSLGTRWTHEEDETDLETNTRVTLSNTCGREQIVNVLWNPWFESSDIWGHRILFWGNNVPVHEWPDLPWPTPWIPEPGNWNRTVAGGTVTTIDVFQFSFWGRDISVQFASCDSTVNVNGRLAYKALLLEPVRPFRGVACPVIPDPALSQRDRELLAHLFRIQRPPPGENPAVTRCRNRDGALSAADAEAACSALAADASAAPPLRADALFHAARARLSAQDYPRAIELGNQALALQPTAATHNDVGTAYFEQGDYAASIGHFNAALQLDPHHPTARRSLASATAHLANPGLRQQDIDQSNRIALEAIGMQRISSLRSGCADEARALNAGSANGVKRAGLNASKLERLISRMMLRGVDQLTQDAQRLRQSPAGPMRAANLYMACLFTAVQPAAVTPSALTAPTRPLLRLSWGFRFDDSGQPDPRSIRELQDEVQRTPTEELVSYTIQYHPDFSARVESVRRVLLDAGVPAAKIRTRSNRRFHFEIESALYPNCTNTRRTFADYAHYRREYGVTGCSD